MESGVKEGCVFQWRAYLITNFVQTCWCMAIKNTRQDSISIIIFK